ncbi:MAG: hypothetical protein K2X82_22890 [Gemmataceae bacterium]|nr:hypothetical protein [Gemmataceae bacterium]
MLELITIDLATLAIAGLFYAWRDGYHSRRKQSLLRQRVSLLLWAAAARAA